MKKKNKEKLDKPKIFQVSLSELSEISFYDTNLEARRQEYLFWIAKREEAQKKIALRLGILDVHSIDWSNLYSTNGQIMVHPQPKVQVEMKGENAKPKLQEEQKQGIPSPEPTKS